jgi:hypothetical protein
MRAAPCMLALLALLACAQAAQAEDFRITLAPGATPRFEALGNASGELAQERPGLLVVWNITTGAPRLVGTVVSHHYFALLERPRQVVPEADDHFFVELPGAELNDTGPSARAVNFTVAPDGTITLALAFPVEAGHAQLRLTRDTDAPPFTVGEVQNLTDSKFYLETTTAEYAFANLVLQTGSEDPILNPTAIPALLQRFPVQGLRPDTAYACYVEFRDWAGNTGRSANFTVRTLPTPERPKPMVTAREPLPGAVLREPVLLVAVNFTGPAPPSLDQVAVFLDKVPTHEGLRLLPGRLEVVPSPPMGPGPHSVGIELTGQEGGTAVERWTFEVARPAPGPAAVAVVALAALALARRRR